VRLVVEQAIPLIFGFINAGALGAISSQGQKVEDRLQDQLVLRRSAAYFLARLSMNVEFHDELITGGGLQACLRLASDGDEECQEYAAFSLAFASSNRDLQRELVERGALAPLVRLMGSEAEPRQYAALALLKLADNFENHVAIAKAGGLQALLQLGRGGLVDDEFQCAAVKMLGVISSNVAAMLPKHTGSDGTVTITGDLGVSAERMLESKTQVALRNGRTKTLAYLSKTLREAKQAANPPVHMRPLTPSELKGARPMKR